MDLEYFIMPTDQNMRGNGNKIWKKEQHYLQINLETYKKLNFQKIDWSNKKENLQVRLMRN